MSMATFLLFFPAAYAKGCFVIEPHGYGLDVRALLYKHTCKEYRMPKVAIVPNGISYERRPIPSADLLQECPFDHTPNAETIAAIQEAHDMRDGKIPEIRFNSFEEFIKDLES
jgi:hypothetical protein